MGETRMSLKTTGPILEFTEHAKELTGGLSAVLLDGDDLWVASDELTSVERLTRRGERRVEQKKMGRREEEGGEELEGWGGGRGKRGGARGRSRRRGGAGGPLGEVDERGGGRGGVRADVFELH